MIILYVGTLMPLAVFLYAGFFRNLPRDYEEAAAIDGASPGRVFFQIVLPLMAPATGTVAILTGLIVWNDFFSALIFLGGSDNQTLPVSMYLYVGSLVSAWNKIFAIVIISMVPILAFYLFAQKTFIQGLRRRHQVAATARGRRPAPSAPPDRSRRRRDEHAKTQRWRRGAHNRSPRPRRRAHNPGSGGPPRQRGRVHRERLPLRPRLARPHPADDP